jgi:hypothetical protein
MGVRVNSATACKRLGQLRLDFLLPLLFPSLLLTRCSAATPKKLNCTICCKVIYCIVPTKANKFWNLYRHVCYYRVHKKSLLYPILSQFNPTHNLTPKNWSRPTTRHEGAWGERRYIHQLILDLGTRWGWVISVTRRPRFSPGERTPGTHCTGGWVGPSAGLDTEARGKILRLCRRSNLDHPVVQPVARHWLTELPSSHNLTPTFLQIFTTLS